MGEMVFIADEKGVNIPELSFPFPAMHKKVAVA
jgi:hypothetical protein